jgi:uncharacterized membrane protein
MVLSSLEFITLLPAIIAAYWLLWNRRLQHAFVAVVTALVMAFDGLFHLWVLLAVVAGTALLVGTANRVTAYRKPILAATIVLVAVTLCVFKYTAWAAALVSMPAPGRRSRPTAASAG